MENIEFEIGPQIVGSYKRLSYTAWYALAEFIDNSTQAYFRNKLKLDEAFKQEGSCLTIEIIYDSNQLIIKDNSIGMNFEELQNAVKLGNPPADVSGRSKYGLGLKTAAFWLGNLWEVKTKKLGEATEHKIIVDAKKIVRNQLNLEYSKKEADSSLHYTIITIKELQRSFAGRTVWKIKEYLRSMYRRDFTSYGLKLIWAGEALEWDYKTEIYDRLIEKDGQLIKRKLNFLVNDKAVSGWVGVFDEGSRRDAGFTLIKAERVIVGPPDAYRPFTLFQNESNDLVNQRLVGELIMDEFEVSHTKDEILFLNDEEEVLEKKLHEECSDLRVLALKHRKINTDDFLEFNEPNNSILAEFHNEITSDEITNYLDTVTLPAKDTIQKTNRIVTESIFQKVQPSLEINIGGVKVDLFIRNDMSPNDPYVIIESTLYKSTVIVILNQRHPYWDSLNSDESILHFIRQCTYDGVAEWKSYSVKGEIDPDTVKLIKDGLLRANFTITNPLS